MRLTTAAVVHIVPTKNGGNMLRTLVDIGKRLSETDVGVIK
jgi:hypothetical protein